MKTIAIVLPERPDDTERLRNHLKKRDITDVHYMSGINAEVFGLATLHTYEYDHPGTNYHIGAKDVGMCLSHYMAWSICRELPDDLFMIIESDVLFVEDWVTRLENCLARAEKVMQGWDIMYIGSCHCLNKEKLQLDGDLWDIKYPLCTHAYIVTKKGIDILLATQRDVYAAIDCALMQKSLPQMKVLTVLPRIADQVNWGNESDAALKW